MNDRIDDAMLSLMDREQLRQAVLRWSVRATRAEANLETAERHLRQAEDREHSLRAEVRGLRNGLPPVTMEALAAAWEAAEVPTDDEPIRAGDVVIEKISASAYAVMSPPPTCGLVGREFRILSRAPREPWQDLADVLDEYRPTPDQLLGWGDDHLAAYLHERGVRVTGGDES